jgi:hypothetical protein
MIELALRSRNVGGLNLGEDPFCMSGVVKLGKINGSIRALRGRQSNTGHSEHQGVIRKYGGMITVRG